MAGTTGFEHATSDVTGRASQRFLFCIPLIVKDLLRALKELFFRCYSTCYSSFFTSFSLGS